MISWWKNIFEKEVLVILIVLNNFFILKIYLICTIPKILFLVIV